MMQAWKFRRRSKLCFLGPLLVLLFLSLILIYRISRSKPNKVRSLDFTEAKAAKGRHRAGIENISILSPLDQNFKRKELTESEEYNAYEDRKEQDKGGKNSSNNSSSVVVDKAISHHIRTDGEAVKRLPQAIIIGVKKGGTRALLEFLRMNPKIRAVGPETHYFDRNYDKGIDWYRNLMPRTYANQITLEKTPSYFVTPQVPALVHSFSKDIRLLVVVRDPVVRAISDYTQTTFKIEEGAVNSHRNFDKLALINQTTVNTEWGAIKIGMYADHLKRWLQYFPLSSFHFVNGNQLILNPGQVMPLAEKFLGLEPTIKEDNFYFNETKGFLCSRKRTEEGQEVSHCLGKSKGRVHPVIDPVHLRRLYQYFEPHNKRFYQMTGIDFGWEKAIPAEE